MDLQKNDNKNRDDQQGMNALEFAGLFQPRCQLLHPAWGIKGCRRLEDNSNHLAIWIEGPNVVAQGLVFAAMPLVFVATAQKIAMELLDMVFRDRNLGPCTKDGLHHFGITGNFLFVAAGKFSYLQIGEQALDLAIRKLAALDARGRTDAFDGGDMAQSLQPLRRERSQRAPCALEFVNLCNQRQQLRRDLNGRGFHNTGIHTGLYLIIDRKTHPFIPDYAVERLPSKRCKPKPAELSGNPRSSAARTPRLLDDRSRCRCASGGLRFLYRRR